MASSFVVRACSLFDTRNGFRCHRWLKYFSLSPTKSLFSCRFLSPGHPRECTVSSRLVPNMSSHAPLGSETTYFPHVEKRVFSSHAFKSKSSYLSHHEYFTSVFHSPCYKNDYSRVCSTVAPSRIIPPTSSVNNRAAARTKRIKQQDIGLNRKNFLRPCNDRRVTHIFQPAIHIASQGAFCIEGTTTAFPSVSIFAPFALLCLSRLPRSL